MVERGTEVKVLFEEISKTKEVLHKDLINMNRDLNEDMVVQQQRMQELGETLFTYQSSTKKRLEELN